MIFSRRIPYEHQQSPHSRQSLGQFLSDDAGDPTGVTALEGHASCTDDIRREITKPTTEDIIIHLMQGQIPDLDIVLGTDLGGQIALADGYPGEGIADRVGRFYEEDLHGQISM